MPIFNMLRMTLKVVEYLFPKWSWRVDNIDKAPFSNSKVLYKYCLTLTLKHLKSSHLLISQGSSFQLFNCAPNTGNVESVQDQCGSADPYLVQNVPIYFVLLEVFEPLPV